MPFSDYDEQMFIFNGDLSVSAPSIPYNRGMKFGETVFTSFLLRNGKVIALKDHETRLKKSLESLYPHLEIPKNLFDSFKKLPTSGVYKTRVNLFTNLTKTSVFSLLELEEMTSDFFTTDEAVNVASGIHALESQLDLTSFKYTNYAITNLISKNKQEVLKMNAKNEVSELSMSNILFFKNGKFILPKGNYLKGICLSLFTEFLDENKIIDSIVKYSDIKEMDGAISLNSVRFLRKISLIDDIKIENKNFSNLKEEFKEFLLKKEKSVC